MRCGYGQWCVRFFKFLSLVLNSEATDQSSLAGVRHLCISLSWISVVGVHCSVHWTERWPIQRVLQVVVVISASRCVGFLLLLLLNSEMTDIWSLIACVHFCGDCVVRLNSKMSRICLSEVLGVSLWNALWRVSQSDAVSLGVSLGPQRWPKFAKKKLFTRRWGF